MKVIKIILGLVAAGVLLVGGFVAGTVITQTRTTNIPVQQFAQPTVVPQQQFQPTVAPLQIQKTLIPQTTPLSIPPQGQWGRGGWMTLAPYASAGVGPQGEWEHGWMMQPNYAPQGQQGWNGMHNGMMNGYGMPGGMMRDWQNDPNWSVTPITPNNSLPTYPTPTSSVSFNNDVQPIFAARCVACHGGTNGLFLDTYENVLKGGVNGAVIIPSDVDNSRLAYYVYSGYMPFRSSPLTSIEIQTILDWIALGAPNN